MDRPHWHPNARYVTVLQGTWYTGTGTTFDLARALPLPPGSVMVHPARAPHWDGSAGHQTVVVETRETVRGRARRSIQNSPSSGSRCLAESGRSRVRLGGLWLPESRQHGWDQLAHSWMYVDCTTEHGVRRACIHHVQDRVDDLIAIQSQYGRTQDLAHLRETRCASP